MNHKPSLPHEDKNLSPCDAQSDLHTPMTSYRVLAVTNMWPHEADPSYGIFVKEQMDSLRPLGVEYDVVFVNGRESRWNYLRGIGQVRCQLREKQYDLIHAHFGLAGWVARFQFRVPLVIDFLGDDVLGPAGMAGSRSWAGSSKSRVISWRASPLRSLCKAKKCGKC